MDEAAALPGGFLPPSLPSPSPSNTSTSSTAGDLPHPRSHPLRAGSAKEDAARRYVEGRLLHISRKFTKKFQPPEENQKDDVKGYESFSEVCADLGDVVDVVWLSGTRTYILCEVESKAALIGGNSKLTNPLSDEHFTLRDKLSPSFSSITKGHFQLVEKARSRIRQFTQRRRHHYRRDFTGFFGGHEGGNE